MKTGLVLQGGGANGSFEAGALQVLVKAGVRFDFISGTSVGALNGGFLAQYRKERQKRGVDALVGIWETITTKLVYRKWYYGLLWFLPALWKMSLFTAKPLRKLIARRFSAARVRASGVGVCIGAVNLRTGRRRVWTEHDILPESIEASAAFPVAFEPVEIDGELYTDDGVRETTPLEAAIKAGCDRIYVILTGQTGAPASRMPRKPRIWDISARNLSAMMAEIELWDLKVAGLYNRMAGTSAAVDGKRRLDIRVIEPAESLGDSLDFSHTKSLANIERGRVAATRAIKSWDVTPISQRDTPVERPT